jgi:hypothetical protein
MMFLQCLVSRVNAAAGPEFHVPGCAEIADRGRSFRPVFAGSESANHLSV